MRISTITALLGLLLAAAPLSAQESGELAWDAPSFLPPHAGQTLGLYGIYTSDEGLGLVGIWRQTGNLGVRIGAVEGEGDGLAVLLGTELYGPVLLDSPRFPIDVAWTAGLGAVLGGGTALRVPAGLSFGSRLLVAGDLVFVPYAHPRLALEVFAEGEQTDVDLAATVDLGLDVRVGESWLVRFGAALFDGAALGIGIAWRRGRPIAVR